MKTNRLPLPGFALFAFGWSVFYLYRHFATETDLGVGLWAWAAVGLAAAAALLVWAWRCVRPVRAAQPE